jgi:hypothetical protein
MKLFATIALSAGLVVAAGSANAQMRAPSEAGPAHLSAASDFEGPYGPPPMPPAPVPRPYGYGPDGYGPNGYGPNYNGYGPRYGDRPPYGDGRYGYGPPLMPLPEVYAVLRENGFSPLGMPHQRGYFWVIGAVDRAGQDGRLVIDGRSGQIIRFTPTYRWGSAYERMRYDGGLPPPYGAQAALPAPTAFRDTPRPPTPVPQPANRVVPMPAPKPVTSSKPATTPQQSALVEARPAQAPAAARPQAAPPQPSATIAQSKPAPQLLPTQEMPKVQGLE